MLCYREAADTGTVQFEGKSAMHPTGGEAQDAGG